MNSYIQRVEGRVAGERLRDAPSGPAQSRAGLSPRVCISVLVLRGAGGNEDS